MFFVVKKTTVSLPFTQSLHMKYFLLVLFNEFLGNTVQEFSK